MNKIKDCKKIQPLLAEYVDGTLCEQSAWSVKLHLSGCAVCALVADEFAQTSKMVASLPVMEPSSDFEAALARRLAGVSLKPRRESPLDRVRDWWNQPRLRPAFGAVAVAALLLPAAFVFAPRTVVPVTSSIVPTPMVSSNEPTLNLETVSEDHVFTASTETLDLSGHL